MMYQTLSHLVLASRFPSLPDIGLAVERFPDYVHPEAPSQHTHDILEMNLLVAGRAWTRIGQREIDLAPGTISLINYGQSHDVFTGPEGADVYNLYLDASHCSLPVIPESLSRWLVSLLPLHPAFLHQNNRIVVVPTGRPQELLALLELIRREQTERREAWREAMNGGLALILMECARAVQVLAESEDDTFGLGATARELAASSLERLRLSIDRHPEQAVRLAGLAAKTGMSVGHLCRSFRKHTGQTIIEYQHHRRVEKAMFLLRTGSAKIVDIAQNCGFADLSQFNRQFKAITGMTPRECRNRDREPG